MVEGSLRSSLGNDRIVLHVEKVPESTGPPFSLRSLQEFDLLVRVSGDIGGGSSRHGSLTIGRGLRLKIKDLVKPKPRK